MAFDTRGMFLGAPSVSVFESYEHKNMASRFRAGVAEDIPFGIYRIEARLTAYSSEVRYVSVYQKHVTIVLGLAFGYELPDIPPILRGRVVGEHSPRTFVKLIGVYSSVSIESLIDADGSFSLGGLSDGQFLLLVVGEKGVLASRAISIPYTGPPLDIHIAGKRVQPPRR